MTLKNASRFVIVTVTSPVPLSQHEVSSFLLPQFGADLSTEESYFPNSKHLLTPV